MGFVNLLQNIFGNNPRSVQVLVLGLDNSGKTTVVNHLKNPQQADQAVPTVGQNVEKFVSHNLTFNTYDMAGQSKYRNLWETHYKSMHGIIFVVDSTDRMRMALARDELWILLDHKDIINRNAPLLILANKNDQKDALLPTEVHHNLGLDMIRNRDWQIFPTCALTGEGIDKAVEWLADNMKKFVETL
uniref:ADP-ribosylation factor-like protein 6 n=1 Tax=Panagrellus redivivus TaxID=6233 RepID=A0A7E4VH90_PANRE